MSALNNVDMLKKVITDSSVDVALKAIESLDQDAKWAIEPLLEIYNAGYAKRKYLSALALIKLREPRVIELLIRDLRAVKMWGHRDGDVNVTAALALGYAERSPEIIEALRQVMIEKETALGFFDTMGFFIPKLGLPQSVSCCLSEVAGLSLVELGDRDSGTQIVHLAILHWHRFNLHKEEFIKYMYKSGWETTISDVASLLQQRPETVVSCLGVIGDEQCVEPLIEALKHEIPDIRKKAIEALANVGGERALRAIAQATDDKNRGVRHTAQKMVKKLSRDK
jgi:HEAT repeat protein